MFQGFALDEICVGEVRMRVRHAGSGTPLVLLHGHPRTHTTWHEVARRLTTAHVVVCPDLRGYGRSTLPPDSPAHAQSSKRAMAHDVVNLMTYLGHDHFAVAGHDRGALVAFRATMDHPDKVSHLVVMDGLPIIEQLERTDAAFAQAYWHWWFLGQTEKLAETLISADPDAWYRTPSPEAMGAGNHADLWTALRDPAVVHGMCEDYLAGLGIDRDHEEADRAAGRRVACPTLLLESSQDDLDQHGDPTMIWRPWLRRPLRHHIIDSGHHQAEEAPEQVAEALSDFLA